MVQTQLIKASDVIRILKHLPPLLRIKISKLEYVNQTLTLSINLRIHISVTVHRVCVLLLFQACVLFALAWYTSVMKLKRAFPSFFWCDTFLSILYAIFSFLPEYKICDGKVLVSCPLIPRLL